MQRDRLKRLAEKIDGLSDKDDRLLAEARQIASLRRQAAGELYAVCADFITGLNRLLSRTEVKLDPPQYESLRFQENGVNLFQINAQGRILQIEFRATAELVSIEDFRVPYILQGTVRCFNQRLLDQDLIEEQFLFYCVEKSRKLWRFFDARTYRSGSFDQDYLAFLMDRLV